MDEPVNNDTNDLEGIYIAYRDQLYVCALAVTRNPSRAEDAVHEAFCRLLGRRPRAVDVKAYVFQCVRNAALDEVRRRSRPDAALQDGLLDLRPKPGEALIQQEFADRVAQAIQRLSENHREVIIQHLYADLTFAEIAVIQKRPMGTIVSWYRRGLEQLRAVLQTEEVK